MCSNLINNFRTQHINNILGTPPAGTPPRPSFLQRDKQYKQRIKSLNKSNAHSVSVSYYSIFLS